ncbi:MAG: ATP-dependent helicase [Bacillota bacterium]|jgi:DNA helicase-2/ATP-dependent DNA helicase PcrA
MEFLNQLNDMQKLAVTTTEGPVLVLAGAGSGKTKALVSRAAYLLQGENIFPGNILAITFTNKAAREMQERMEKLTGYSVQNMWVGTFHGICLRILRRESKYTDYDSNFVIYDDNDQQILLKNIIKQKGLNDKEYAPRAVSSEISHAKNILLTPDDYDAEITTEWENTVGAIYREYEKRLVEANALDFDDLIMKVIELFEKHPERLEFYQNRFKYILVDEYQDTNYAQYKLIQQLAAAHRNVCAVGDPDQSIYSWRGADISNILNFEQDYPDCSVIKLEQNYRSTKNILEAANNVISHNLQRKPKNLWTEAESGSLIDYHELPDDRNEGTYVVETIAMNRSAEHRSFKDYAVIYRTHTQARVIEEALIKFGYPYRIYGGLRFYERKEIKDTLAYLRVLVNTNDDLSLTRIINEPKRSIGNTSVEKLRVYAERTGCSLYDTLNDEQALGLVGPAARKSIGKFYEMMEKLRGKVNEISIPELLENLWVSIGYREHLEKNDATAAEAKIENLKEFVAAAVEFENNCKIALEAAEARKQSPDYDELLDSTEDKAPTLDNFLAQISLSTDLDNWDEEDGSVTLLTMHATKGLEFPVVFMVGMEEKIFPHSRSYLDENEMEEERRLCYVAMTRARERLYMSGSVRRNVFGQYEQMKPSRFIDEIPAEYIELHTLKQTFTKTKAYTDDTTSRKTNLFTGKGRDTVKRSKPAEVKLINIGDKVQHAKFGTGIVVKVDGKGDDAELHIAFAGQGIKSFIQKYAPIKKIH